MIKMILADDEPVIAKGLKKILPWQTMGIEVVGIAFDGLEAQRMLIDLAPDVMISDICMPGLTGLQILKMISEQKLKTKVIFLSGFQEFHYAQEAVRYGATEYLLKPVDKEQLEQAINRAVSQIKGEKATVEMVDKLNHMEEAFEEVKIDQYYEGLILGHGVKDRNQRILDTGQPSEEDVYTVLNIRIEASLDPIQLSVEEKSLLQFSVKNVVESFFEPMYKNMTFYKGDILCVILCQKAEQSILLYQADQLLQAIEQSINRKATIGIGETVVDMQKIHQSYDAAQEALLASYFFGVNRTIGRAELAHQPHTIEELHKTQGGLIASILAYDYGRVQEQVSQLMTIIQSVSSWDKGIAISHLIGVMTFVHKELSSNGIEEQGASGINELSMGTLKQLLDYKSVTEWVQHYYETLMTQIIKKARNNQSGYIQKVKSYIETHYAENITLETVAEIACMNAYYFSTYFKKQTGEKFKDYLTRIRMENAVRLLMDTDSKVYEISEKVGFNDYRHFSEMFRKYYGKTPSDYKKCTFS